MIQVILKQSVPGLGATGELVQVSAGYARNFLLPQNKALIATAGSIAEIEHHKKIYAARLAKEKAAAVEFAKKFKNLTINLKRKAGENEKLFGSVTNSDIAEALKAQNIAIDRRQIEIAEPIKQLGVHAAQIKLHPEVIADVKVWVEAET